MYPVHTGGYPLPAAGGILLLLQSVAEIAHYGVAGGLGDQFQAQKLVGMFLEHAGQEHEAGVVEPVAAFFGELDGV